MQKDESRPGGDAGGDESLGATEIRSEGSSPGSGGRVRFTPGTMLAGRYRIVAILGRGGMGEVYRAEDTRLGQPVALKFLPQEFASDPNKLQRLYREVRLGRRVSHPNVCRLYDVEEVDGHHFITMEYIDGEDLASLLRRIGKLPEEKALDLARDLCAGLAAAHGLDIVHRDLKPANVMIDGRGDARITDFGLAALAEDLRSSREIAGTPAYMAPEQMSGGETGPRTDLYSLGLILYEMFTGKQLFRGDTVGEIISQRHSTSSQSISRETGSLDPAIQRLIVRCLEPDPERRPASIHAVIAALPGGDPLQAAIDAGETPSPEMIAAAGATGELKPSIAWPLVILTVLVVLAAAGLSPRVRLYGQVELPHRAYELAVRARQILAAAGLTARPADTAWEFSVDPSYRLWKRDRIAAGEETPERLDGIFSPLAFGYREAREEMVHPSSGRVSGFGTVPPMVLEGMASVVLEPDGRLRKMVIVPPEEGATRADVRSERWAPLFEAAGLNAAGMREIEPEWRPPVGSDRRYAWLVEIEGLPDPVRVEAATLGGTPVWFEVFTPWRRALEPFFATRRPMQYLFDLVGLLVIVGAVGVAAMLAVRNVRRGRGNRAGALKVALAVAASLYASSLLWNDHYADPAVEIGVLFDRAANAGAVGVLVWLSYLALEPYLRRRWPRTLISWNRLLQRRWFDPLVGRHLLIGVLAGASVRLVLLASLEAPAWLGWPRPIPLDASFLELSGWRYNAGYVFQRLSFSTIEALGWMVVLLFAHLIVRRRGIAVGIVFVLMATGFAFENHPILEWTVRLAFATAASLLMVRYGLVALAAMLVTGNLFDVFPMTLDPAAWYFGSSLLALALILGVAVFGFFRSLGAQAAFGQPILED